MRYLPLTDEDRRGMLAKIGVPSVESLYNDVPRAALLKQPVDLPPHAGELEVERAIGRMAAKNMGTGAVPSFLGAGAYRHHVPASVDHLIQRGEFLTSYTPYQPEVTQGTLQVLFEFQTQVALLTGMDVANASMYDGATSAVEAVMMANRVTRRKKALVSGGLHPHYRQVIETYGEHTGFSVTSAPYDPENREDLVKQIDKETSCVVVQTPSFFGHLADLSAVSEAAHAAGALLITVTTEAISFGLIRAPGNIGADVAVAEGQSLGNSLGFGGPYVGLFACKEKFLRQMPGRLAGQTVDVDGKRGWVLTLSTREQHIRREKATSNICTNSGLCALAFTIHLTLLGEAGLQRLAEINHANASRLADRLANIPGVKLLNETFFNEFTLALSKPAAPVVEAMAKRKVLGGVPVSRLVPPNSPNGDPKLANLLLVAATETVTDDDMTALETALKESLAEVK